MLATLYFERFLHKNTSHLKWQENTFNCHAVLLGERMFSMSFPGSQVRRHSHQWLSFIHCSSLSSTPNPNLHPQHNKRCKLPIPSSSAYLETTLFQWGAWGFGGDGYENSRMIGYMSDFVRRKEWEVLAWEGEGRGKEGRKLFRVSEQRWRQRMIVRWRSRWTWFVWVLTSASMWNCGPTGSFVVNSMYVFFPQNGRSLPNLSLSELGSEVEVF